MKERPILFSAPMVRAILDGTKTQTRRVAKDLVGFTGSGQPLTARGGFPCEYACPYGQPGDVLWVRESWCASSAHDDLAPRDIPPGDSVEYKADPERVLTGKTRPSMFMPRWASRITLEIVSVRVERLQDISCNDAIAEGIERQSSYVGTAWKSYASADGWFPEGKGTAPIRSYRTLWESINGPGSWDANPWVWVVEFRRVEAV